MCLIAHIFRNTNLFIIMINVPGAPFASPDIFNLKDRFQFIYSSFLLKWSKHIFWPTLLFQLSFCSGFVEEINRDVNAATVNLTYINLVYDTTVWSYTHHFYHGFVPDCASHELSPARERRKYSTPLLHASHWLSFITNRSICSRYIPTV